MEIELGLFHPTLFWKDERRQQILHKYACDPFRTKLKTFRDSASKDRFHYSHFNLEIVQSVQFLEPSIVSLKSDRVNGPLN